MNLRSIAALALAEDAASNRGGAAPSAPSNPDFESKHPRGNSGNKGQFRKSAKTLAKLDEADAALSPDGRAKNAHSPSAEYAAVIAKYKGTPEWMKAPNGEPTNLTERQWVQVRTPSFKAWFGDWENDPENASKVIDSNGEPKVVYHSTNARFDTFARKQENDAGWLGEGFYFYGDKSLNGQYGRNVMQCFLNVREPYYMSEEEHFRLAEADDKEASRVFSEQVREGGYDGVYWNGDLNQEYAVFEPGQIKSATSNSGSFSPDKESILDSAPVFNHAAFLTYLAGKKKESTTHS